MVGFCVALIQADVHPGAMSPKTPVCRRIAVVGTGLIGSSWAAFFLARGFDVVASDPASGAEEKLRAFVERCWPTLTQLGVTEGSSRERLSFVSTAAAAVEGADFVQESGPERLELKHRLYAEMDEAAGPEVILASSTSGLTMSAIQTVCRKPERCVVGHPFNPPHVMPLVEIVGGKTTSPETIERADTFYSSLGKHTIRLNREVPGHVANRLQAALWREAVHLVSEGVVDVADVDAAVTAGPGLRWAIMGPNLIFHLGGGPGGMAHFMEHLSGPFTSWWEDLGEPRLTPELKQTLIEGTKAEAGEQSIEALARRRDEALVGILKLLSSSKHTRV